MKKLSKKTSSILWALAYFGLVCAVAVTGCIGFHRFYFCSVFVSGTSMEPTLLGGNFSGNKGTANYGIIDTSDYALQRMKRFDIITAYYPWNSSDYKLETNPETLEEYYVPGHPNPDGDAPDRKIKRILALPGETIKIVNGDFLIGKVPEVYHNSKNALKVDKDYKFGALPFDNYDWHMHLFSSATTSFYTSSVYDDAIDVSFEKSGTDLKYYFKYKIKNNDDTITYKYINVKKNGDLNRLTYDLVPETLWSFNSQYDTITTEIIDHDSPENDGEYMFVYSPSDSEYYINLKKVTLFDKTTDRPANLLSRNEDELILYSRELIKNNEPYVNYEKFKDIEENYLIPFERKFDSRPYSVKDQNSEVVLMDGRYWIQGDHWSSSTDCGDSGHGPIYYENIDGILVAIEGTCTIRVGEDGKKECVDHHRTGLQIIK